MSVDSGELIVLTNITPITQKCICLMEESLIVFVTGINVNKSQTVLHRTLDDSADLNKILKVIKDEDTSNIFGELYRSHTKRNFRYYFHDTSKVDSRLSSLNFHFNTTNRANAMIFIIECPFCAFINKSCSTKSFPEIYFENKSGHKLTFTTVMELFRNDFFELNLEMQKYKNYFLNCLYTISKTNEKYNENNNRKTSIVPKIVFLINHTDKLIPKDQLKQKTVDHAKRKTTIISDGPNRCPWVDCTKMGVLRPKNEEKQMSYIIDDMFYKMFGLELNVLPNMKGSKDLEMLGTKYGELSCSDLQEANETTRAKINLFTNHVSLQTLHNVDNFIKQFQKLVIVQQ